MSAFDKVKGVGMGHSWWRQQFCPTETVGEAAIGIVLTEQAPTLALYVHLLSKLMFWCKISFKSF